jgi:integrase/recombinase XerD
MEETVAPYQLALAPGGGAVRAPGPVPVEYAVAVEEYLAQSSLGPASCRVYRISLTGWAWPLVGRAVPTGPQRRRAVPPVVPLALLDDLGADAKIATAVAERARVTDARTVNRELSALRSAIAWWQDQRWIRSDPTAGLHHLQRQPAGAALTAGQVDQIFRMAANLREHAFWRVLHDSSAHVGELLGLDVDQLDLSAHRVRPARGGDVAIEWGEGTSQVLRWLLAGRSYGPVFVTDRRAPADAAAGDVCPVTRRGRMSYRRAAEIFTEVTRPLDPAGKGWTLQQLRAAGAVGAAWRCADLYKPGCGCRA